MTNIEIKQLKVCSIDELDIGMKVRSNDGNYDGIITKLGMSIDNNWDIEIRWFVYGKDFGTRRYLHKRVTYLVEIEHKSIKSQILYSVKCKLCGSPSRHTSALTFCSNTKCKSRKQFRKFMAKFEFAKIIDRFIRCPICNLIANDSTLYTNGNNFPNMTCFNKHSWFHNLQGGEQIIVGDIYKYILTWPITGGWRIESPLIDTV